MTFWVESAPHFWRALRAIIDQRDLEIYDHLTTQVLRGCALQPSFGSGPSPQKLSTAKGEAQLGDYVMAQRGIFIVRGATHCCAVDAAAGLVADGQTEAPLSATTLRATIGAAVELMQIVPKMGGGGAKRRRQH